MKRVVNGIEYNIRDDRKVSFHFHWNSFNDDLQVVVLNCEECNKVIISTEERFENGWTWHYCEEGKDG